MKFKSITELPNKELKNTPFEFIILKLSDIYIVALNKQFKDLDITLNQANFLIVINTEKSIPQSYISQLLNIHGGRVTKALKRLENKNLVEIFPDPKNKSKNIVKITEKGKEVTKEFVKIINQIEDEIFSEYTNEEKEKLKVTLRELSKKYYELNP